MPIIANRRITAPAAEGDDGLGFCDGQEYVVLDSIIDLSGVPLDAMDEAVGVTWGSSAIFRRCHIKGAGKLILCGCGDDDHVRQETGRHVVLEDCLLEDFGRRGPEVQDGMICEMERCVIRGWGDPSRFSVRNFGSWAHHGGVILARDCVWQNTFRLDNWLRDLCGHIGQAWNDEGVNGLLRLSTWLPGITHALRATAGGFVSAVNSYAPWWFIMQGREGKMDKTDAKIMVARLERMAAELDARLERRAA